MNFSNRKMQHWKSPLVNEQLLSYMDGYDTDLLNRLDPEYNDNRKLSNYLGNIIHYFYDKLMGQFVQ